MAVIDPARLRGVVERVVAARGILPPGSRDELVAVLTSALIGPVARDEYLAALEDAHRSSGTAAPAGVAVDVPVPAFLRDGPDALGDELLLRVATSPESVRTLADRVTIGMATGEVGDVWWQAAEAVAGQSPADYLGPAAIDRNRERLRQLVATTKPAADATTQSGHARWRRLATFGLAIAASLLLAFFLGRQWPAKNSDREVRLASVTVRGEVVRGIEDVAIDVTNGSDRRVFLTFVGLVPGRKTPAYHYRQEGRYIEVPAQGTTAVANLPPEFEGTAVVLVFSTPVPAGGAIREVTPAGVSPDSADQDAERIKKALADLSIDADVKVVSIPIARR